MKAFWKIPVFFSVCSFLGPWTSATVVKRRPRFPVNSISNGGDELCPKVRIGQDDLPGFDLISQFQVDKAASRRAIQRVVGSTALQVAYKLGNNVDFRIPTRHLYPSGLPEEYSFLTTFRMTGSTLEKNWSIWQIQDSSGKEQVGVKINGQTKSVAFSYKGLDGSLQSAVFSNLPSLFDSQWHKVMIGVERSTATLFVDCNRIESLPIEPRGQINVDGFAVLGKLADNPQGSVPETQGTWYITDIKNSVLDDMVVVMAVTILSYTKDTSQNIFTYIQGLTVYNVKLKLVTKIYSSTFTLCKKK